MSLEDEDGIRPPPHPGGMDPEFRQFVSRLMTGYEAGHRRVADLCDTLVARLEKAEAVTARSLELQVKIAEEREELISRRHTRELEAQAASTKAEAFSKLTADVRALAPLLGKKLLGIPLTGDDSHGLQDLLSTLTPDQIGGVIESGTLTLTLGQRQLLGATVLSLDAAEKPKPPEDGSGAIGGNGSIGGSIAKAAE